MDRNIYILYVDDMRVCPYSNISKDALYLREIFFDDVVVDTAYSYKEALKKIETFWQNRGMDLLFVDFDHDLGEGRTGYDLAKKLVEKGIYGFYYVHSMNPVGKENICNLLDHYKWHKMVYVDRNRNGDHRWREAKFFGQG